MSNVQPVTPNSPTTSVALALLAVPALPPRPINPVFLSVTPTQTVPENSAVQQLSSNYVTAMVTQQALYYVPMPADQRNNAGVIPGLTGVTLNQISQPGQSMKPGSGEFVQQLREINPNAPFPVVATQVLMTGNYGVNNAQNLTTNLASQTGAVSGSVQSATTFLTNNGILTGKEAPTQVAGVIMSAAITSPQTVLQALQNPGTVAANVGGATNPIGLGIANGSFAAKVADTRANGVGGVVVGLGSLNPSELDPYAGALQNAFNVAEKSFGKLEADKPNTLGFVSDVDDLKISDAVTKMIALSNARDDLAAAEKLLVQARRAYDIDGTDEAYLNMREVENQVADAARKVAGLEREISGNMLAQPTQNSNGLFGTVPAQVATGIAAATESGRAGQPTTSNSGINAIPGGAAAFTGQTGNTTSNILNTLKTVAGTVSSTVAGAFTNLADPTKLSGNILGNIQGAISGIANAVSKTISGVAGAVGAVATNIAGAINSLVGGTVNSAAGLLSGITSSLLSLGNSPGQIKPPILASNTYGDTKSAINSVIGSTLDPRVPPPTFEEVVPKFEANPYLKSQVQAQMALNDLYAARQVATLKLDRTVEEYIRTQQASLVDSITALRNEVTKIDIQISQAQKTYDRIISGQQT